MAELHPAACFRGGDGRQGRSPAFLCVQPLCPVSCSRSVKGCPLLFYAYSLTGERHSRFSFSLSLLFSFIFSFIPFFSRLFSLLFSLLYPFSSNFLLLPSLFYVLFLPFFFSPLFSSLSFFSPCGGRRARVWRPWHDLYVGRHTHV